MADGVAHEEGNIRGANSKSTQEMERRGEEEEEEETERCIGGRGFRANQWRRRGYAQPGVVAPAPALQVQGQINRRRERSSIAQVFSLGQG